MAQLLANIEQVEKYVFDENVIEKFVFFNNAYNLLSKIIFPFNFQEIVIGIAF